MPAVSMTPSEEFRNRAQTCGATSKSKKRDQISSSQSNGDLINEILGDRRAHQNVQARLSAELPQALRARVHQSRRNCVRSFTQRALQRITTGFTLLISAYTGMGTGRAAQVSIVRASRKLWGHCAARIRRRRVCSRPKRRILRGFAAVEEVASWSTPPLGPPTVVKC